MRIINIVLLLLLSSGPLGRTKLLLQVCAVGMKKNSVHPDACREMERV